MSKDMVDRQGRPIDVMEWARLRDNFEYRKVAGDVVGLPGGGTVNVLTLWHGDTPALVGCPHCQPFGTAWSHPGPLPGRWHELATYATEAEAQAGHATAVNAFRRNGFAPS